MLLPSLDFIPLKVVLEFPWREFLRFRYVHKSKLRRRFYLQLPIKLPSQYLFDFQLAFQVPSLHQAIPTNLKNSEAHRISTTPSHLPLLPSKPPFPVTHNFQTRVKLFSN